MKKFLISALCAVGIAAMSLPAFAVEHEFGGYWRTRAYTQKDFWPNGASDLSVVDTRTRLYYTAKFSENFKFVNKFEFNTIWGDDDGGDIGADGKNDWRVKNSYVDMTFCDWNVKVGIQGATYARGFLFDDDFSGISLTYKGNGFTIPFVWMMAVEGGEGYNTTTGKKNETYDVEYYFINPSFDYNENIKVNPFFMWVRSQDLSEYADRYAGAQLNFPGYISGATTGLDSADLYYLGLNMDFDYDAFSLWFTGIYMFGSMEYEKGWGRDKGYDVKAFLVALGGEADLGPFSVHAQTFYATGDDNDLNDYKMEAFVAPVGQSYVWSEIMGHRTFDDYESFNAPGEYPSNIWAVNLGATMKPVEKWTVEADLWYAQTAEDVDTWDSTVLNRKQDDKLGFEIDLAATYQIFDNMNIRFVGAYLFADDATGDDDPWLLGTQLEFSF
ncbi:hypothetical protein LJC24_01130 [Desulfococcaceae bacterium OttesenSCG-928-F15]|nr:hypothetical protein [Desulfococcaceae bacterium OttesenSCG-928-F15]